MASSFREKFEAISQNHGLTGIFFCVKCLSEAVDSNAKGPILCNHRAMGNGMNKILPGLFIGNFRDSKDERQLEENNITHIVSIHDNAKPLREDRTYLCISASDIPGQDISQHFTECFDFIHSARLSGGAVLIHCLAGVSRSVTVAVAYVMSVTTLGWKEALFAVRQARTCANPNFGFKRQLHDFETNHVEEQRRRIGEAFPENNLDDESYCHTLLKEFSQRSFSPFGYTEDMNFCLEPKVPTAESLQSTFAQFPAKTCPHVRKDNLSVGVTSSLSEPATPISPSQNSQNGINNDDDINKVKSAPACLAARNNFTYITQGDNDVGKCHTNIADQKPDDKGVPCSDLSSKLKCTNACDSNVNQNVDSLTKLHITDTSGQSKNIEKEDTKEVAD